MAGEMSGRKQLLCMLPVALGAGPGVPHPSACVQAVQDQKVTRSSHRAWINIQWRLTNLVAFCDDVGTAVDG